jgi:hypothetical protein
VRSCPLKKWALLARVVAFKFFLVLSCLLNGFSVLRRAESMASPDIGRQRRVDARAAAQGALAVETRPAASMCNAASPPALASDSACHCAAPARCTSALPHAPCLAATGSRTSAMSGGQASVCAT